MGRILALVLRVASVPVGVGFGIWTAHLRSYPYCPPGGPCQGFPSGPPPTFALWQCALFAAGVAIVVLFLSLAGSLTNGLRVASVPVGVVVGFWTSQLMTDPNNCPPKALCLDMYAPKPIFATWQCILFGAGAAAVLLLLSLAASRLPSAAYPRLPKGIDPSPRKVSY
jgi:hypothetical protein